jgi:hypothetical protein
MRNRLEREVLGSTESRCTFWSWAPETVTDKPRDATHWSNRDMAKATGMSRTLGRPPRGFAGQWTRARLRLRRGRQHHRERRPLARSGVHLEATARRREDLSGDVQRQTEAADLARRRRIRLREGVLENRVSVSASMPGPSSRTWSLGTPSSANTRMVTRPWNASAFSISDVATS